MLKDPFAMPSRSPSSARSSRALYAPRLKPLAQAIALLLVAGGAQAAGQPFSAAWFAAKGAAQGGAAGAPRPGAQLPGAPPPLAQQQRVNQQLQRSMANLNNTVAAIAAQQAAQAAGRQAALNLRRMFRTGSARAASRSTPRCRSSRPGRTPRDRCRPRPPARPR